MRERGHLAAVRPGVANALPRRHDAVTGLGHASLRRPEEAGAARDRMADPVDHLVVALGPMVLRVKVGSSSFVQHPGDDTVARIRSVRIVFGPVMQALAAHDRFNGSPGTACSSSRSETNAGSIGPLVTVCTSGNPVTDLYR